MEPIEIPTKAVTGLRITVGSLVMGIPVFAVIVVAMRGQNGPIAPNLAFVAYMGVAMLAIVVVLQFVMLPVIDAAARKRIDPSRNELTPWLNAWTSRSITGCALIEGAAFMCLTGAMIDGQPLGLVAGLAGAALIIVFHWPTETKLRDYVERQREKALNEGGGNG